MVKSTFAIRADSGFVPQNPLGKSQSSVPPVPENTKFLLAFIGTIHTQRMGTHANKKLIDIN